MNRSFIPVWSCTKIDSDILICYLVLFYCRVLQRNLILIVYPNVNYNRAFRVYVRLIDFE